MAQSDVTLEEERGAYRWLFIVGAIAVLICVFLATVDKHLSESDREERLGETLRELRGAQASLDSHVTDVRQVEGERHLLAVPVNH